MIEDWFFWRKWEVKEKALFFFTVLMILGVFCGLLYFSMIGENAILSENIATELIEKTVQTPAHFFDKYSFSSTTPLWYVKEFYLPSSFKVNAIYYYLWLGCVLIGITYLLAAFSRLKGFWFLVGALALGGILVTFRLESAFLLNNNWPFLIAFGLAGAVYFLSNVYAHKLTVFKTTLIWVLFWAVFLSTIQYFSIINFPLLSLASYGLSAGLLITFIFIFLISHELLATILSYISNSAKKGYSSLPQVIVITIVFLFNALLIYLENANRIPLNSFIISPLIIYITQLVLGLWGFKSIAEQRVWFTFRGVGIWIYLGLAVISTATLFTAYSNFNVPIIELFEDFISISFLAMGLCYIGYMVVIFHKPIRSGLAFHKIMYKPPYGRFLVARLAGVFLIFTLFTIKKQYSLYQFKAGINNAIADFYLKEGDVQSAEVYYKNALVYDPLNARSNFSLADMSTNAGSWISAIYYYTQAGKKDPLAESYLGESHAYESQEMYFEALFTLKKGIEKLPKDHRLYTNLARLQGRTGITDSVLINLDHALQLCKNCSPENANFLAFWIENGKSEKLDEMQKLAGNAKGYAYKANISALDRLKATTTNFEAFDLPTDSALDNSRAAFLLNSISNPSVEMPKTLNANTLIALQKSPLNDRFFEQLSWAFSNQKYFRENKMEGLKQLSFLAQSPSKLAPIYHQNLGLWFLQQGAFHEALQQLQAAGDSSSISLLKSSDLESQFKKKLQSQSESLASNLSLKNYQEILNKAPLNPWLLIKVADFLSKNKKPLDAYNTLFYALDFLPDSPELLTAYINKALDLSMLEYAQDALINAEGKISSEQLKILKNRLVEIKNQNITFN